MTSTGAGGGEPFLDHYLPFLLVRTDTLLSRPFHAELTRLGFTVAEWRILATLFDGQQRPVGRLAELVLLPQPTVSRWVDRLASQGLVQRGEGSDDRRRTVVSITRRGHTVAAALVESASNHQANIFDDVPAPDLARLESLLRALIARLDRPDLRPAVRHLRAVDDGAGA